MSKKTKKKHTKKLTDPKSAASPSAPDVALEAAIDQPLTAKLDPRLPPPGTLLQKLDRHGAVRCECCIDEGGVNYRGHTYRSLSAAAMAAAGDLGLANKTQNGFTFWGLSKPSRRPGDALAGLNRAWERYRAQVEGLTKTAEKPEGLLPALDQHAKTMESLLGSVA